LSITSAGAAFAPLTSNRAILRLSPEEAAASHPVQVAGVVLDVNPQVGGLWLQDETADIYVGHALRPGLAVRSGSRVSIEGSTQAGGYAPSIVASRIQVLGTVPLPEPRERSYSQLATGSEELRWVRVAGIIRLADVELRDKTGRPERYVLETAIDGGRITVSVPAQADEDPTRLVDSSASIVGICVPVYNRNRQLLAIRIRVPTRAQISFTPPAASATFASPSRPISSLFRFEPEADEVHRVKVEGEVTLQVPGSFLVLQRGSQGLRVKSRQPTHAAIGTQVEVLGFPAFGDYQPLLEDAIFRVKPGHHPSVNPEPVKAVQAQGGDHQMELVRMEGTVLDLAHLDDNEIFTIADGPVLFQATVPAAAGSPLPMVEPGSRVSLVGVCEMQGRGSALRRPFSLLMRSPADLEVLVRPSWWTLRRMAAVLGGMTLILLTGSFWIITLRRQVRMQTVEIQRKAQREAVLEERARIAREFHDTIEQQLAAITLQVQAARTNLAGAGEDAHHVLKLAESMLRHTRSEARRSVWDLRALALENGTLESAVRAVVNLARNGSAISATVTVGGPARELEAAIESHLLRIAQEAVTNAVKHSGARAIAVTLAYRPDTVCLTVTDDGRGFAVDPSASAASGHFGLLGMRERIERIGGELAIESAPGRGTRIEATVPLGVALPT
jgi:signal transduction histidine kinase